MSFLNWRSNNRDTLQMIHPGQVYYYKQILHVSIVAAKLYAIVLFDKPPCVCYSTQSFSTHININQKNVCYIFLLSDNTYHIYLIWFSYFNSESRISANPKILCCSNKMYPFQGKGYINSTEWNHFDPVVAR